jgi:DnaJ like chaperone protein
MFINIQLQAAFSDGSFAISEERLLIHICSRLRLSRFEFERLKIQLQAQQRFHTGSSSNIQKNLQKQNLQDAYSILGLSPSASKDEVKNAYRRLMSQNHPDKLVAKGLPEEMMLLAKEKTQKIRKAYETILKTAQI